MSSGGRNSDFKRPEHVAVWLVSVKRCFCDNPNTSKICPSSLPCLRFTHLLAECRNSRRAPAHHAPRIPTSPGLNLGSESIINPVVRL
ncbi:hypothetical protein G7K_5043-t1 [Saitoella complicata NRRL Y-17804]|uniref:Uncharacterized protein n=1 Tax=Saitoella complicata (strain BCRC 22490 / CBS 7301 / JCM 7358 / NBRC 10748 / NRRL Y-17804) TaxID=698492 RepID=A0A0E9NM63_SAICN|nr:hypothetical protein G7K_5043-t1 [Saitoella complicata NRRL Y-17804]